MQEHERQQLDQPYPEGLRVGSDAAFGVGNGDDVGRAAAPVKKPLDGRGHGRVRDADDGDRPQCGGGARPL